MLPYGALLMLASGDEETSNNLAQHDGRIEKLGTGCV